MVGVRGFEPPDLCVPNAALYLAELHPDKVPVHYETPLFMHKPTFYVFCILFTVTTFASCSIIYID